MLDTTEFVIAANPHVATRIASFIRQGTIPRTMHSEIEAKAEYMSRGFMAARYRLYRCEFRAGYSRYSDITPSLEAQGEYAQNLAMIAGA